MGFDFPVMQLVGCRRDMFFNITREAWIDFLLRGMFFCFGVSKISMLRS